MHNVWSRHLWDQIQWLRKLECKVWYQSDDMMSPTDTGHRVVPGQSVHIRHGWGYGISGWCQYQRTWWRTKETEEASGWIKKIK